MIPSTACRDFVALILLGAMWFPVGVAGQDGDGDLLADSVDPYPSDPFNGGWGLQPSSDGSSPLPRHEGDGCRIGNQWMVLAGRETKMVQFYDPVTNAWSQTVGAPLSFHHCQAAYVNGLIYVIGAFTGAYPDETPVPDIYIYNPASKSWSKGPSIPLARRRGATATGVYNGKIYVAGGNTLGHRAGWVAWFDEFDPATGSWTQLADAPQPRDHHRALVVQDRLYLVSGRRSNYGQSGGTTGNTIPEVEVYDFAAGVWSILPNPIPTPRAGCGVISHGRDLIVIAGENATGPLDKVESLDVISGTWRIFPALAQKRNGPVATSFGDKLYVSGGQAAANASMEVLLLPPRPLPSPQPDPDPTPEPVHTCAPLQSAQGATFQPVLSLNCGGSAAGDFSADARFSGGTVSSVAAPIFGAANAPEAVYKTERVGNFNYRITGLESASCYRIDLHFAELTHEAAGQRTFDVQLNGELILDNFDIFQAAGGKNKAINRFFPAHPRPDGTISVNFASVNGQAKLSGLSLTKVLPYSGGGAFSFGRPADVLARVGDPVAFGARVNGRLPTRFQWRRNGGGVDGGTGATLAIAAASLDQAGAYSVLGDGWNESQSGQLTVVGQPEIPRFVLAGATATLAIPYAGSGAAFRWSKDGEALEDTSSISGSGSNSLAISNFSASDAGAYRCVVEGFGDTELLGPWNLRLPLPPSVTSGPPPTGIVIGSINWQLSADEGPATFTVEGLPAGLLYDPVTQSVKGTPLNPGIYTVRVTAKSTAGTGPTQSFSLAVESVPLSFCGTCVGLVDRAPAVNGDLGGALDLNVTNSGLLSGRLRNAGSSHSFTGRLSGDAGADATFQASIPRGIQPPLLLRLTFQRSGDPVVGTLSVGSASVSVVARHIVVNPLGAVAFTTTLNCFLGIEAEEKIGDVNVPQGTGWMRLTRAVGRTTTTITGTGRLADGSPLTFASNECTDRQVPLHSLFSALNGSALGWGGVTETSPQRHEFLGRVNWRKLKPVNSIDFAYRDGIDLDLLAEGITYVRPPSGKTFVGNVESNGNARIEFSQGGLATAAQAGRVNRLFKLRASHLAGFGNSTFNPAALSLVIDVKTGTFPGGFRLRDGSTVRDVRYQGIFAGITGEGYFTLRQLPLLRTSPVLSGLVRISAP